ncbi:hypothetical protein, partial [Massilia genomosp. 1]|uniref:hypothetical protein n=1 Tax=Massilia genomosp. 1 TaxID=2609280 RepID=UPI001C9E8233
AKDESKPEMRRVYKGRVKSLNVNRFSARSAPRARLVYNEVPYTTVYIWLASQVVSNSVVTQVTSPMTEVVFGGGNNTASLAYDSATGMFIASSTNNSSKLVLTQHEALL